MLPGSPRRAVIVAGGDAPGPQVLGWAEPFEFWIAVDGGADHAVATGRWPSVIIGDLDSISRSTLAEARARGIPVHEFPADKDKTDLELALDLAAGHQVDDVLVVAASGGRRDHELANLLVLCQSEYGDMQVCCAAGETLYTVVRGESELRGRVGEVVTLLPLLGDAVDVTATGLRYALSNDTLIAGTSRGVSNEFRETTARLEVGTGVVLVVQPFALASER